MDVPLEIAWHNVAKSDALEEAIRDRVDKLHRYFKHINSVHVVVDMPHRSQHAKKDYHVRIETRVPGDELVVSNDPHKRGNHYDPYIAMRDAFDAMDRQLEGFSQRVRGDVKTLEGQPQGRVVRKFETYGFVEATDGQEYWFNETAVVQGEFDDLKEGDSVELSISESIGAMGPQASMVRPIGPMELMGEVPSRT
ncbi:HPF/RaiA family ribosome-associated protein [Tranquillimonas alkanivorans]|uniref:Ribosomal subunit interface protein n=1 Tax=Tranquillimonas alkanivorans TaxID=441119 RepID=A0A1I5RU47_9RHOB|nr:HPF/RaiA family ribosome-associated protein [Tranquillimonas alkanivorans]SFP61476.1 ribosomal subunit interface protein [Tranquillimonas alkanivorans]